MKIVKILSASIIGTLAMTLYGNLISQNKSADERAPLLLNMFLGKKWTLFPGNGSYLDGRVMHYLAGLMFSIVYHRLNEDSSTKASFASALLLGGLLGMVAVELWKKAFEIHPDPPPIHFRQYYKDIFTAHVVFGIATMSGYCLPDLIKDTSTKITLPRRSFTSLQDSKS